MDRVVIEGAKLAIETLPRRSVPVTEVVAESIRTLMRYGEESGRKECGETALAQIIAWLELGMEYGLLEELFDEVLLKNQVSKTALVGRYGRPEKGSRSTKNRIRALIGRWRRGRPQDLALDEVVEDIYRRMLHDSSGCQTYLCHSADGSVFGMIELILSDQKIVLHDRKQKRYYYFAGGRDAEDRAGG